MEGVQIVGSLDVATLLFTLFNLFFVGLVFYLAREGRREGYPLESDETGKLEPIGNSWLPNPKTFKLPDGREKSVPNDVRDPSIEGRATRTAPWAGAPIEPVGDPMKAALGSGAYTMREDIPDMTHENLPKIVPMSSMPDFSVASEGTNPHGFDVVGADGEVAGTISDIWIDRAEALVRYYEVELADGGRKVLLPYGFADVKGKTSVVDVPFILASQFADVPAHAKADQVTRLEEDKISAYYGGGIMYATPDRAESLI